MKTSNNNVLFNIWIFTIITILSTTELHNGSVDNKALVLYIGSLYEEMKDLEMPGLNKVSKNNKDVLVGVLLMIWGEMSKGWVLWFFRLFSVRH